MKILFVSSGNSENGVSPIVKRQGNTISEAGINIHYFPINGKGFKGYFSNIKSLKQTIREMQPDIIHAHYSMSAFTATLSGAKPLVVSLMGSDVKASGIFKLIITLFSKLFWHHTIVKSEDMQKSLGSKNVSVIPNGVDKKLFNPIDKTHCCSKLNWNINKTHILFAADPKRPEKNFNLAKESINLLNQKNIELHSLGRTPPEEVPLWMNAADIVMLTSFREGSPNVIKEAMACSRPIVATDVGDIKWLFGKEAGHFISSFDPTDMAKKIELALEFSEKKERTNGRERILELGLDAERVARRLVEVYEEALERR